LYSHQYPLLGNPQVCMAKVLWDQAVPWAVPDLLFFRGKLTDVTFMASIRTELERYFQINELVQTLFREWDKLDRRERRDGWLGVEREEFPTQLHLNLARSCTDEELYVQVQDNIRLLEAVAMYLLDEAANRTPGLVSNGRLSSLTSRSLQRARADGSLRTLVPPDLDRIWLGESEPAAARGA